ncbi:hypothetical protein V12B01_12980 [Vibrio splendidus 12B01]|nr:hypothetical protein V12B01_12980 [Vibrio splendidus 12B01]
MRSTDKQHSSIMAYLLTADIYNSLYL